MNNFLIIKASNNKEHKRKYMRDSKKLGTIVSDKEKC